MYELFAGLLKILAGAGFYGFNGHFNGGLWPATECEKGCCSVILLIVITGAELLVAIAINADHKVVGCFIWVIDRWVLNQAVRIIWPARSDRPRQLGECVFGRCDHCRCIVGHILVGTIEGDFK